MDTADSEMNHLAKSYQFSNDIIVIDGIWGVGKSAISPVVASMRGVEKKRIDPIIEYLAALRWLGKLDVDTAAAMIANYCDYFTYHNAIGREVNLRLRDDSGLKNSPGWARYLWRAFRADGDHVEADIDATNPATLLITDLSIVGIDILERALGARLKFIEVVRHPLHLFNYYRNYLVDYSRRREFTLSFEKQRERIPWIAQDWPDLYLTSSVSDRAALLISRSQRLVSNSSKIDSMMTIAFEQFVTDTDSQIEQISDFLGRPIHYPLRGVKRRHRIPRAEVSSGKASNTRSWISSTSDAEANTYRDLLRLVDESCTREVSAEFLRAVEFYEMSWPSQLSEIGRTK